MHLEGVQRVAVQRGVDLGLDDAEADALEEGADPREQVLAVGRVDHHLHAFPDRAQPGLDHRLLGVDAVVQQPRVPGDLASVVAQEVGACRAAPTACSCTPSGSAYELELLQRKLSDGSAGGCRQDWCRPPRKRRVDQNRSSSSLPFQAFHTFGLVPRMSATVSRYKAVSRRSLSTTAREIADDAADRTDPSSAPRRT